MAEWKLFAVVNDPDNGIVNELTEVIGFGIDEVYNSAGSLIGGHPCIRLLRKTGDCLYVPLFDSKSCTFMPQEVGSMTKQ